MKRSWLAGLLLLCSGCGGNEDTSDAETPSGTGGAPSGSATPSALLEVVGVLQTPDLDCMVAVDPNAPMHESGTLDYVVASHYTAMLLVRTEPSVAEIVGATVTVTIDGVTGSFQPPWQEFPEEWSSVVDGYHAAGVPLTHSSMNLTIGAELASAPRDARKHADVSVVVHGLTADGEQIASAPWSYSIELCYGCLVTFPPEALEQQSDGSMVCTPPDQGALCATVACSCLMGSDDPIDCRLCADGPNPEDVCLTPP